VPAPAPRVFLVPWVDDPYLDLLAGGLERVLAPRGVPLVRARRLSPRFAARVRRDDVVHLQWLDYVYRAGREGPAGAAIAAVKAARMLLTLWIARARGARLVLTAHNLAPHDSPIPRIDRLVARAVACLIDARVVHSAYARSVIEEAVPSPAPTVVMPFGAFTTRYPPPSAPREQIRQALGLPPGARVALAFGQVRPYKRLDDLLTAFAAVPDADARLVIAGRAPNPADAKAIRTQAAHDPRVVLALERIPDQDVAGLYAACDVAVIPYREVFSSGALVLALSLGLPAVAPSRGAATELGGPPVIRGFADGELSRVLTEALAPPTADDAGDLAARARAAVDDVTWEHAARIVVKQAYAWPAASSA
jgi:beta-1,4-mannosyltransferase